MSLSSATCVLRSSSNTIPFYLSRCWQSGTSSAAPLPKSGTSSVGAFRATTISTPVCPATSAWSRLSHLTKLSRKSYSGSFRAFSSSSTTFNNMAPSTQTLVELAKARRSYYHLGKKAPVADSEIVDLVKQAILHIPSSFNTQSTRVVVALHGDHEKVWDITADALKGLVATGAITQESFDTQTKPKLDAFKAAYGTILFYEDPAHIKPYAEKFPAFGDKFPQWAEHSNAMHQWFLWAGLESLGFGANLQHYNPLIDAEVAKTFSVPSEWQLKAQLVFGSIESPASEKSFNPVEDRVKVFGAQ